MRKNLSLLFLLLPLAVFSAECVKLSEGLYRLENELIKADISAVGGARCLSLVDKRTGLEYTSPASDMGVGGECDWQEKKMKNSSANKVSRVLQGPTIVSPIIRNVTAHSRMRLHRRPLKTKSLN